MLNKFELNAAQMEEISGGIIEGGCILIPGPKRPGQMSASMVQDENEQPWNDGKFPPKP